jgi:hypothetical protein
MSWGEATVFIMQKNTDSRKLGQGEIFEGENWDLDSRRDYRRRMLMRSWTFFQRWILYRDWREGEEQEQGGFSLLSSALSSEVYCLQLLERRRQGQRQEERGERERRRRRKETRRNVKGGKETGEWRDGRERSLRTERRVKRGEERRVR